MKRYATQKSGAAKPSRWIDGLGTEETMRANDIVLGESYRHKDHPRYCWAKAVKVLRPKEGENTTTRIVVKCEWSQDKSDTFCLIKYFSPADLVPNAMYAAKSAE